MSEIRVGDRVRFRAGRGYAVGRVANITEASGSTIKIARIATDKGLFVNRVLSSCQLVRCGTDCETIVVGEVTVTGE